MNNSSSRSTTESSNSPTAVVLVHLGTPASPSASDVRKFLRPFLSDRRVVEAPPWLWWFVLNMFILPFRPQRVAKNYLKLWDEYGDSPLRIYANKIETALQASLDDSQYQVFTAVTYGELSIAAVFDSLRQQGFTKIVVLPLYPQYSATTTAAVYDQICHYQTQQRDILDIHFIKHYCYEPGYQRALKQSVEEFWQAHGRGDCLLMSFHGVPKKYCDEGDPYYLQCTDTAKTLANALNLADEQWQASYQSRIGRLEWLQPYTSEVVVELAQRGKKIVDVICPSFSTDCLETLEEIADENNERFVSAGGTQLRLIPCLNDASPHIEMMRELILRHANVFSSQTFET